MSIIGEVVGVVACVAGVISAYRDGGAIIQRIKIKRADTRAPPPPRLLEESIGQAPEAIEKEKQRGIARFGRVFEEGDHIAIIALQQITIQLQGTLLEKLRTAAFDDEVTDFNNLVDVVDLERDRSIGVLHDLKQRLLQAEPISEIHSPTGERTSVANISRPPTHTKTPSDGSALDASSIPASVKHNQTWSLTPTPAPSGDEDTQSGADDTHHHARKHRHSSLLGVFKHRRTHSDHKGSDADESRRESASPSYFPFRPPHRRSSHNNSTSHPKLDDDDLRRASASPSHLAASPPQQSDVREDGSSSKSGATEKPKFTYQEGEDNPFEIWGAKATQESQRRDTLSVPPDGPSGSGSTPHRDSRAAIMRNLSNAPTTVKNTGGSVAVPTPTPENDFLGFCRGAWRLQNGERRAMQKCKEFNDGWSHSVVHFLACSQNKCAYAGHIDLDIIWTKVWKMKESNGIKFRWSFLAKSHVSQTKVKDHQYMYQCIFCVFLGSQPPVIHGTDLYLEHIVQEHRVQALSDVVLYKTCCVNDRICDDSEDFDINLYPLTAEEQARQRKQSDVLSDDLLFGRPNADANDSMFCNEPWNEGLSDFHIGGELELTERE